MWASAPTADSWTGFYFGGQIGLVGMKSHEKGPAVPNGEALLGDIPVQAGVFGGFHWQQTDWWVWGLDAELNIEQGEFFYNGSKFGSMEMDGAVRVQGGYLVAPNVLAYASVGYSWAHFDNRAYYGGGATGADFIGGGLQLGLGVDAMVTDTIMARLQMTWAHYGEHAVSSGGGAATSEPSMIDIRTGVAWKF
ncbi:MAG: porin family protein [Alphaproteobacteria bacterium]|nr:porin family protein [Alphaproteobacteria bacterium]